MQFVRVIANITDYLLSQALYNHMRQIIPIYFTDVETEISWLNDIVRVISGNWQHWDSKN